MSESTTEPHPPLLRDLGSGLVLRRAREQDIEPLVAFFARIFEPRAGDEVRAVIKETSQRGSLEQFTVVEDTTTGQIVSSLTLLEKTLRYENIPFGVGQPEFVATDPAYRRRGLVRAQIETVHAWSEARGDKMQLIDGILNYYRQFGYVRIPDLADFVQHIVPVLERRLAESILVGHTGELKLSFYRSGLRLVLERGKITSVEPWQPTVEDGGIVRFPDLTFVQILLGYRSLEELEYAFKDCYHHSDEARALVRALFPKQMSHIFVSISSSGSL